MMRHFFLLSPYRVAAILSIAPCIFSLFLVQARVTTELAREGRTQAHPVVQPGKNDWGNDYRSSWQNLRCPVVVMQDGSKTPFIKEHGSAKVGKRGDAFEHGTDHTTEDAETCGHACLLEPRCTGFAYSPGSSLFLLCFSSINYLDFPMRTIYFGN